MVMITAPLAPGWQHDPKCSTGGGTKLSPAFWFNPPQNGRVAGAESSKPRLSRPAGASKTQPRPPILSISTEQYGDLWADADDAKPDVVVTSLRLESQPEGGPAGPAII